MFTAFVSSDDPLEAAILCSV